MLLLVGLLAATGCAGRSVAAGEGASQDARIHAEAMGELAEIDELDLGTLELEVRNGIATLSGVQETLESVSEALRRLARLRGVTEVVNRVRILRVAGLFAGGSSRRLSR